MGRRLQQCTSPFQLRLLDWLRGGGWPRHPLHWRLQLRQQNPPRRAQLSLLWHPSCWQGSPQRHGFSRQTDLSRRHTFAWWLDFSVKSVPLSDSLPSSGVTSFGGQVPLGGPISLSRVISFHSTTTFRSWTSLNDSFSSGSWIPPGRLRFLLRWDFSRQKGPPQLHPLPQWWRRWRCPWQLHRLQWSCCF